MALLNLTKISSRSAQVFLMPASPILQHSTSRSIPCLKKDSGENEKLYRAEGNFPNQH